MKTMHGKENIPAILVERDYKGTYERFALTPEEFRKEFPEVFENTTNGEITETDTFTLSPLVHIWFSPTVVNSRMWKKFFTSMTWGLPSIDVECGNLAYVRIDFMKSLLPYLSKDTVTEFPDNNGNTKHKVRISEIMSKVISVESRTRAEALECVMKKYYDCDIMLDSTDMHEVTFTYEEENKND